MSADRDVTRIVRSWLEEGRTALPDRVLDTVLDLLPATPQRRAFGPARRFADMNNVIRIAVAAAAVVVATVGGVNLIMRTQPGVSSTGSQTSRPAGSLQLAGPRTIYGTADLDPGTYTIGRWFPVQLQLAVPAGWETWGTNAAVVRIWKPSPAPDSHSAILSLEIVRGVYSDACQGTYNASVGESVDDLVNALTHVVGLQAGSVTDIVVDGHPGKAFDLARSTGPDGQSCPRGTELAQWTSDGPVGFGDGAHQRVLVLNVGGTRLVLDAVTYLESSRAIDSAEMDAIVGSIKFQP